MNSTAFNWSFIANPMLLLPTLLFWSFSGCTEVHGTNYPVKEMDCDFYLGSGEGEVLRICPSVSEDNVVLSSAGNAEDGAASSGDCSITFSARSTDSGWSGYATNYDRDLHRVDLDELADNPIVIELEKSNKGYIVQVRNDWLCPMRVGYGGLYRPIERQ